MEAAAKKYSTVNEYFDAFPAATKKLLKELRSTIKAIVPEAEEVISYNMPAIKLHRILVYYAAYKHHIGFYPGGSGIQNFQKEIAKFKNSKGAVQFPLDQPLPLGLVTKIVKFRVKESLEKQKEKAKK